MTAVLRNWLEQQISGLEYERHTKAYITSVLHRYVHAADDLSDKSVVLLYANAGHDFDTYQMIGDWVLWVGTFHPSVLDVHRSVYLTLGRMSYDKCYKLLHRQWVLYEELADQLPKIMVETRKTFFESVNSEKHDDLLIL